MAIDKIKKIDAKEVKEAEEYHDKLRRMGLYTSAIFGGATTVEEQEALEKAVRGGDKTVAAILKASNIITKQ